MYCSLALRVVGICNGAIKAVNGIMQLSLMYTGIYLTAMSTDDDSIVAQSKVCN